MQGPININITYFEYYIAIYGPSASATFFNIVSQTARFPKEKLFNIKCALNLFTAFSEKFLILRKSEEILS